MQSGDVQCDLLVGPAAITAQVLLVTIVLLGLFHKRNKEVPPRPLLVWGMDVSKQLVSSGMAHILGMLIAMIAQLQATGQVTTECSWYFVIFSVDTTLGVVLVLSMHTACVRLAKRRLLKQDSSGQTDWSSSEEEEMADDMEQQLTGQRLKAGSRIDWHWIYESIADCGSYGIPPSPVKWAVQLAQFSACVVLARVMCGAVVISGTPALSHVAAALDRAFRGHPTALLFFVMVFCPVLMNTGQAWLQDHFLKWAGWGAPGAPTPRRTDGGHAWEELGRVSEGMQVRAAEEPEERPGAVLGARVGRGASLSLQRTKSPVPAAGADRRLWLPHE